MIRTLIHRFLAWHRAINACQTCDQREGTNLDCPECDEFNKMMGIVVVEDTRLSTPEHRDGRG